MDTETIEATRQLIYQALYKVYDPELGVNIVDLGLIYGVDLRADGFVSIRMTLTTQGCPMHESISDGVGQAIQFIPGLTAGEIVLVWEPAWDPSKMTAAGRQELGFPSENE
ncbi:DNA methyltransferase [Dictyobacter alpinus]|uniref:DNA methyltransferase n=1 Tax=Dictyobacter alpinus TaxID=2014873 RepID=A0A402BF43_9CHLR|nr:metal-sulfur cluster assembly factor [Dictyobacter alpinus]GCE29910.1 DNA methyltransferase [Dictyobacter alpinus]